MPPAAGGFFSYSPEASSALLRSRPLAQIRNGVFEKDRPERRAGAAGIVRVVGRVIEGFGMGHEPKDTPGGVGQTGYGVRRPVGVGRVVHGRPARGWIGVLQNHGAGGHELLEDGRLQGHELAFAVAHGQVQARQALGKNARALRIDGERHPAILEPSRIVGGQTHLPHEGSAAESRQQAEFDQKLETVADAEDKTAGLEKIFELVKKGRAGMRPGMAPAHGRGLGGAEVVAVEEPAGKDQKIIKIDTRPTGDQIRKKDDIRDIGAGHAGGVGRFHLAIGPIAGNYEGPHLAHWEILPEVP